MAISAATLNITTQIVGANIVVAALGRVHQAVTQATSGSEQAYKSYETPSLSLQSLVAREKLRANSTLSMRDAMRAAEVQSQRLLQWTQRLAIDSPFTQEGVADAFRMAQAYGFVSESADKTVVSATRLTQAVIDYVAASGQGESVMSRVALALGQIAAKGRLQGDEMLQLTEAGINVRDILARAFKVPTDELIRMQERGLIPAKAAILAIVEGLEKDFGGAAKSSATTLQGLQASLADVVTVLQRRATAPFFEVYKTELAEFISFLQSDAVQVRIDALAIRVESMTRTAAAIVDGAQPSLAAMLGLLERAAGTATALIDQVTGALGQLTGVQSPEELGAGLVPGVLGLGAALQFEARTREQVAENTAKQAAMTRELADAQTAAYETSTAAQDAMSRYQELLGNTNATAQEREAAAQELHQRDLEATKARTRETEALARQKQGLGSRLRELKGPLGESVKRLVAQAGAMAAVGIATAAAAQAYQNYTEQLNRQAQAATSGQDAEIARLEKLLNAGPQQQQTEAQRQAEAAQMDAAEALANLKRMREQFRQETAADAEKAAMVRTAAVMANAVAQAIAVPFKLIGMAIITSLRDAIAVLPNMSGQVAQLDQQMRDLWDMPVQLGPLQQLADETTAVAVANAQAREAALAKAVADTEASIAASQRAQVEATLTAELTKQQTDALTSLSKAEVDFATGQIERRREYDRQLTGMARSHHRQLEGMARSHARSLANIAENRQEAIRDLARQAAKDATGALDALIGADTQFRTDLGARQEAFRVAQQDAEANYQEQREVLRRQGALRDLRRLDRNYAEQQEAANVAQREQERQVADAYARQLAQQQQHLGRMLVDYIRAQGTMRGLSGRQIDAMTAALRREYGIQETLAERAFGKQKDALDGWLASGGQNTDAVIGQLRDYRDAAVQVQMQIDATTKQRTAALAAQFDAGALSVDQYVQALQRVPNEVSDQIGTTQTGAAQSDRLQEIEKNARQQRAAQQRAYREQLADAERAYKEQLDEAKQAFIDQEKAAFDSYARQRLDYEKHLTLMNTIQREGVDARIRDQVREQVALNESLRRQLDDLWKIRGTLTPDEFDRRMRQIVQQGGAVQNTITSGVQAPRAPNPMQQLERDYGASAGRPRRAAGGPMWPGTTYWVGERGPEPVRPLVPTMAYPAGTRPPQGGSVTVNINGATVDSSRRVQELATLIERKVMAALNGQLDGALLTGVGI